jgi:hypothetical protein
MRCVLIAFAMCMAAAAQDPTPAPTCTDLPLAGGSPWSEGVNDPVQSMSGNCAGGNCDYERIRNTSFLRLKCYLVKKGVLQTPPPLSSFDLFFWPLPQLMHSPRDCRPSLVCGSVSERPRARSKWSLFLQYQMIKVQLVKKWHVRNGCSVPSAK